MLMRLRITVRIAKRNFQKELAMIYIGCDHAGYPLKKEVEAYLDENKIEYRDLGCNGESVDYPVIAAAVCNEMKKDGSDKGILICGTGIGICMAANKIKGIRAANCSDYYSTKYTRLHNDANVLCLGGRTIGGGLAIMLTECFLNTQFEGGRHARRVAQIDEL